MMRKAWLVTGSSNDFGLSTVMELLKQGYKVAATTRSIDRLVTALGPTINRNFLPLNVDLTSDSSIKSAISQTIDAFGQLDVVVNNAGYGLAGAIEEVTRDEIFSRAVAQNEALLKEIQDWKCVGIATDLQ
jgi:NAD(P)-dependent dehydrogenase (short-subunit alcohol dehydrogenase family)